MSDRPVVAALLASLSLAAGATACSSSGGGPTGPAAAAPTRIGVVEVDPFSGPVGTMFTLTARGLSEGAVVAFEITFPGEGRAYPGAALTVPPDGTATTTYRATSANQPGDYGVRLNGAPGSLAEGRFTITDGPPLTTTTTGDASLSSTTLRNGPTTSRSGRSTTTTASAGPPTTSTVKAPASTATTRRTTTTMRSTTTVAR